MCELPPQEHHPCLDHDLICLELPAVEGVLDVVSVAGYHKALHLLLALLVVHGLLTPDCEVTLYFLVHVLVVF